MSELPPGWTDATIGDLADVIRGVTYDKNDARDAPADGLVALLRANNIQNDTLVLTDLVFVPTSCVAEVQRLRRGDIVMAASSGSKTVVGKSAQLRNEWAGSFGAFCYAVRPAGVEASFLGYFMRSPDYRAKVSELSAGVNINNLRREHVSSQALGLPPLNEQRRMVEKLDAIFEKSRAAKARLERLPALLDKLKRSILAAAFRGDLTKDWRAAHPDVEPAPTIDFEPETKAGRMWGSGASADMPARALPPKWRWARVKELGPDAVQIGPMSMKSSEFTDAGTTVLNVGCVQWGRLDLTKRDHLPENRARDFERYRVRAGDVLFTRSGTVGRIALASTEVEGALITFHLLRVRTDSRIALAPFLYLALRGAPEVRVAIEDVAVGATRAGFNTRLLEDLWIPLPPLAEQVEIERQANAALRSVDDLGARLGRIEGTATRLEQTALAKAFRGELVPQDPSDEPASVLLERIRAARADEPTRPRRGRAAKPAAEAKQDAAPRANGERPEVAEAAPLDVVVGAFQQASRLTASAIGEATGLDAATVKKALKALVDAGQVRVEGKARGTTYVWSL